MQNSYSFAMQKEQTISNVPSAKYLTNLVCFKFAIDKSAKMRLHYSVCNYMHL